VATRIELAQQYLERSVANDIDATLALLSDDVVLNRGMLGTVTGKDAVADAMRNRPAGMGGFAPSFEAPAEAGEQVTVKGNLPPGSPFPISSLTWTFSYSGDKISRIGIGF
jgi:ketosteroid isomerase-like protein